MVVKRAFAGRLSREGIAEGPAFVVHVHGSGQGMAYSSFHYEHFMQLLANVKMIRVEGIAPDRETIRNRTYPIVTEVYVVTKKGIAADSPATQLRDFLLSKEGQRLVDASGYVPIIP